MTSTQLSNSKLTNPNDKDKLLDSAHRHSHNITTID